MKIAVLGLWHLGTVTAACMAKAGHNVIALDPDGSVVADLLQAKPPVAEPGLDMALRDGMVNKRLRFTSDSEELGKAELLWVTFDTPVDDYDQADAESVISRVRQAIPHLHDDTVILVSSQLPVGSTARMEKEAVSMGKHLHFAYSPENLRLGKALDVFLNPDRVVVGTRSEHSRIVIRRMLKPITDNILWMSPESAEMAKHAINCFLAMSIAYSNELATLCEKCGADASDVERALRSEGRIGKKAYVAPGPAFSGGTLARDAAFLIEEGRQAGLPMYLTKAIIESNNYHKQWLKRKIETFFAGATHPQVALWGLTYKPGTNTLRRSASVELCKWMKDRHYLVHVHDPAFTDLPAELAGVAEFFSDPVQACSGCDILIVATPWSTYLEIEAEQLINVMTKPVVIDPFRFLQARMGSSAHIRYLTIGA